MSARWPRVLAYAACLGLAAYLRLSGVRAAIGADEVAVLGPDAAFHARRMLQTWQHFPHVPIRDALLDWPHGAVVQWPPGFDLLGALLAAPFSSRFAALIVFSSLPVLLGLLLVLATARAVHVLARGRERALPFVAGLCAAFVVAVLPQAVSVARFSNTDHHVVEALILLALGMWSFAACGALTAGTLDPRRRLVLELAGGLASFAALGLFIGSTAYVAIAVIPLGLANALGWRAQRVTWAVGAPGLLAGAICTALLYRPVVEASGLRFDYVFPSYLQPLLVGVAGLGCAAASAVGFVVSLGRRRALAGALALVALCALLALALWAHPATAALRHGIHEWFGGGNVLLTSTSESVPLFAGTRFWERAFYARCHRYYGLFGVLAPLFFALAALATRGQLRRTFPFWIWTAAIVTMALYQNRFGRLALVNLAIAIALALAYVAERAPRLRVLIWSVPLLIFALDPAFRFYLLPAPSGPLPAEVEAGVFLRTHARPARLGQRSGVLTPWDASHYVVRYAQRPVTATGFGFYIGPATFDRVDQLWLGEERALVSFMQERDLGYVMQSAAGNGYGSNVLRGRGPFVVDGAGQVGLNVPWFQRLPLGPLLLGGTGLSGYGVRHLQGLLPLHASRAVVADNFPLPRLWVYEQVPGATLYGSAAPGALVRLLLQLRARGFGAEHEAWTRAGADGSFALVTPLPSAYRADGIATAPRAQLLAADQPLAELAISEAQVRGGARIAIGASPAPQPPAVQAPPAAIPSSAPRSDSAGAR